MTRPKPSPETISDLFLGVVSGYLRDTDVSRMAGKSGRIVFEVELCLDRGEVPWSKGSTRCEERRNY